MASLTLFRYNLKFNNLLFLSLEEILFNNSLLEVNPLTPVLPATGRDEPWPFFHFWCHHFWPKLASSILNYCRRKRSFQWCRDQSDRTNGAWDMHKNAQKVEWKAQSKFSCHYTWSRWLFLRCFSTASKPMSITAAKRKEKKKIKERRKKNSKIEKPKDILFHCAIFSSVILNGINVVFSMAQSVSQHRTLNQIMSLEDL